MLTLRRSLALLFACAALIFGLLVAVTRGDGYAQSVTNSRILEGQFRQATDAIRAFETAHRRLPTPGEFDDGFPQRAGYQIRLELPGSHTCDDASPVYGRLRDRDYFLSAWRGEWTECHAPTKSLSTLALHPDDYAMLGSVARDQSVFGSAAILCLLLAIGLWRRWGREREA